MGSSRVSEEINLLPSTDWIILHTINFMKSQGCANWFFKINALQLLKVSKPPQFSAQKHHDWVFDFISHSWLLYFTSSKFEFIVITNWIINDRLYTLRMYDRNVLSNLPNPIKLFSHCANEPCLAADIKTNCASATDFCVKEKVILTNKTILIVVSLSWLTRGLDDAYT